MDLSVLEGDDPAGYRAESRQKAWRKRLEEGPRKKGKGTKPKNPGDAFVSDTIFKRARRSRQVDLGKSTITTTRGRVAKELDGLYKTRKETISKELDSKAVKRREKRLKKKIKAKSDPAKPISDDVGDHDSDKVTHLKSG